MTYSIKYITCEDCGFHRGTHKKELKTIKNSDKGGGAVVILFDFESFRDFLLNSDDYTTEDMELILRAMSDYERKLTQ